MKCKQLNESIDYVLKGETLEDRVARARDINANDSSFLPYMRMATQAEDRIMGLPEGLPSTYKPERDIPDGIADTTARQELRRIKKFQQYGDITTSLIKPYRREIIWIELLEGMHWKESAVMMHIKDQTLLGAYPGLSEVLKEAFDLVGCINKPEDQPQLEASSEGPKVPSVPKKRGRRKKTDDKTPEQNLIQAIKDVE